MTGKYDEVILSVGADQWSDVLKVHPQLKRKKSRANSIRIKHSLPPFDPPARLKYPVNERYFSSPDIQNSYWAGLIAADGCIYEKVSPAAQAVINLELKDEVSVKNFHTTIGGRFMKVNKPEGKNGVQYRWATSSDTIASDLRHNYDIFPKKSGKEQAPRDLDDDQALAFIAGFIDGDGSYIVDKRTGYPSLQIVGSEEILSWINEILYEGHYRIHPHKSIYSLSSFGKRALQTQRAFLELEVPMMERKLEVWKELR